MPSKVKKLDRAVAKLPSIPKDLVNQFLTDPMTEEAINAAGFAFKQALIEAPRAGSSNTCERSPPTSCSRTGIICSIHRRRRDTPTLTRRPNQTYGIHTFHLPCRPGSDSP